MAGDPLAQVETDTITVPPLSVNSIDRRLVCFSPVRAVGLRPPPTAMWPEREPDGVSTLVAPWKGRAVGWQASNAAIRWPFRLDLGSCLSLRSLPHSAPMGLLLRGAHAIGLSGRVGGPWAFP